VGLTMPFSSAQATRSIAPYFESTWDIFDYNHVDVFCDKPFRSGIPDALFHGNSPLSWSLAPVDTQVPPRVNPVEEPRSRL
jgi:hypothetical protein